MNARTRKTRLIEQNRRCHLIGRLAHRAFFLDGEKKARAVALIAKQHRGTLVIRAGKCPVPRKRELSLEEGNGETATRMLAILALGERSRSEPASELGISSQPWLSRAYLNPLMAQGYIALTLPKKPKSPLQRYRLTLLPHMVVWERQWQLDLWPMELNREEKEYESKMRGFERDCRSRAKAF